MKSIEQYYPTYKAKERDVLLIEFEEAQKIANAQTKIFEQITSLLLATSTFIFTYLLNNDTSSSNTHKSYVFTNPILLFCLISIIGGIMMSYFVNLQKKITINARKTITLRTLLGVDYGSINLTIPNWRVEGASDPFVIKYFNGWLKFKTMPFWIITITANAIWYLVTNNIDTYKFSLGYYIITVYWCYGNIAISFLYFYIFRVNLYDLHETFYLKFVVTICYLLNIKLLKNFEYILYRAKLAQYELDRLEIDYKNFYKILVAIEDNNYYSHNGVSFKALARASLSRFKWVRNKTGFIKHGASTITMQLSRTLFIPSSQNKYKRKIAELLLSIWLNKQFTKKEVLNLYIASVQYKGGVLGLAKALKCFFGTIKSKKISNEEAFFLIERLSNNSATVNESRIKYLIKKTNVDINKKELERIYNNQIKKNNIISSMNINLLN